MTKGHSFTPEETRKKRHLMLIARWANPEYKERLRAKMEGRLVSEETRKKISEAAMGRNKGILPKNFHLLMTPEAIHKANETRARLRAEGKYKAWVRQNPVWLPKYPKGHVPWNVGKRYKNPKESETLKRLYAEGKLIPYNKGKKLSAEHIKALSLARAKKITNEQLLAEHQKGLTSLEIGRMYKMNDSSVSERLRKLGLKPNTKIALEYFLKKEELEPLLNMHTQREAAKILKCSESTIVKYAEMFEINFRSKIKLKVQEIEKRLAAGRSLKEITADMHLKKTAIYSYIKKYKLDEKYGLRLKRPLTEEQQQKIAVLIAQGFDASKISKQFKISDNTVRRLAKNMNLQLSLSPRYITPIQMQKISELYKSGFTLTEIANRMNISAPTLSGKLKNMGMNNLKQNYIKRRSGGIYTEAKKLIPYSEILKNFDPTKSFEQIGRELGTHGQSIKKALLVMRVAIPATKYSKQKYSAIVDSIEKEAQNIVKGEIREIVISTGNARIIKNKLATRLPNITITLFDNKLYLEKC